MSFWNPIENQDSLHELLKSPDQVPLLILKHSNRCALSSMAKNRIEKSRDDRLEYQLIDVVRNRDVSNLLAEIFSIQHESPQAFLIVNSKLVEVKSHLAIRPEAFSTIMDSFASQSAN